MVATNHYLIQKLYCIVNLIPRLYLKNYLIKNEVIERKLIYTHKLPLHSKVAAQVFGGGAHRSSENCRLLELKKERKARISEACSKTLKYASVSFNVKAKTLT